MLERIYRTEGHNLQRKEKHLNKNFLIKDIHFAFILDDVRRNARSCITYLKNSSIKNDIMAIGGAAFAQKETATCQLLQGNLQHWPLQTVGTN